MEENQEKVQEVKKEKSNSLNPLLIVGIVVIIIVAGMVFVMGKKGTNTENSDSMTPMPTTSSSTTSQTNASPTVAAADTSTDSSGEQTITMEAGSFYFKPNVITVKKGQKVKVVMTSKDMMHDFNIDELGVKMPITKAGETNTVEFTPDKTGTFEYYCSVGHHRQLGQVGKITVE